MTKAIRGSGARRVPLSEIGEDLSRFLREADGEEFIITCNGKPAGVPAGFASDNDWFDHQLENDARFLCRIERARESLQEGCRVSIEDVD